MENFPTLNALWLIWAFLQYKCLINSLNFLYLLDKAYWKSTYFKKQVHGESLNFQEAKNVPDQLKLPLDLANIQSVDLNNVDSFKAWNGSSVNSNVGSDNKGDP